MSLGKLRIFTKNQGYFYQTGTKDNLLFKCPLPDQSSQVLLKNAPPAILNTWFLIPKGAFQFLTKQIKKIYYPHLARFYP